jgi:HK97 family phage major capsid protein
MADDKKTLVEQLREKRVGRVEKWADFIEARETARREFEARKDVTDEERTDFATAEDAFSAKSEKYEADILVLDERIRVQDSVSKRRAKAAKAVAGTDARVTHEPMTYREDNASEYSYFRDLAVVMIPDAAASVRTTSPKAASERLFRHAKEMDVEMPKRSEARARRAASEVEGAENEFRRSVGHNRRAENFSPFEQRTNPNRTDGQGGYFVPPLWLVDQYIPGLRPGRVAAGLARNLALPAGTDSINIPKLATLTQVGIQGADNAPVVSQDYTDTAVTANIKTLAGQEDVAIQVIEQSPGQIVDRVIVEDLMADYDKQLDLQVVQGNGTNSSALNGGQVLGLYPAGNWNGTNSVSYTAGSPVQSDMFALFGAMQSNVARTRFYTGPSFAFLAHPRRAFWFASGVDTQGRPLVESRNFGPFNVDAVEVDSVPAEGLVAQLPWGPRLYHDANVPTNVSGTQDPVIGAVWDDCWLFEGEMRTRVLPEILSGTLQLRYQVYNYVAFLLRYGQSLVIATGAGLVSPTGPSGITF